MSSPCHSCSGTGFFFQPGGFVTGRTTGSCIESALRVRRTSQQNRRLSPVSFSGGIIVRTMRRRGDRRQRPNVVQRRPCPGSVLQYRAGKTRLGKQVQNWLYLDTTGRLHPQNTVTVVQIKIDAVVRKKQAQLPDYTVGVRAVVYVCSEYFNHCTQHS